MKRVNCINQWQINFGALCSFMGDSELYMAFPEPNYQSLQRSYKYLSRTAFTNQMFSEYQGNMAKIFPYLQFQLKPNLKSFYKAICSSDKAQQEVAKEDKIILIKQVFEFYCRVLLKVQSHYERASSESTNSSSYIPLGIHNKFWKGDVQTVLKSGLSNFIELLSNQYYEYQEEFV